MVKANVWEKCPLMCLLSDGTRKTAYTLGLDERTGKLRIMVTPGREDVQLTLTHDQLTRDRTIRLPDADGKVTLDELAAASGLFVPSGAIFPFAGATAPGGYLTCDGSSYLRADYPALFAAIGTAWGAADADHFNVPDLRGRFMRGVDGGAGRDPDRATRTASSAGGNTGDNVGSVQTCEYGQHTHTQDAHTHTQNAHGHYIQSSVSGSSKNNTYLTFGTANAAAAGYCKVTATGIAVAESYSGASSSTGMYCSIVNATATNQNATATNQNSGGNETRPVNAGVNYIIKI